MPHLLLILDGYGIAADPSVSAVDAARKPFLDGLFARHPHGTLDASGRAVGLPPGQMGNSEVGHTNLGAGRVVNQDITRIDLAIERGTFYETPALVAAARHARDGGGQFHLMGLLSDGGVHAHTAHVEALLEVARREGVPAERVAVHAFTDGRDTDPHGGAGYVRALEDAMMRLGDGVAPYGRVASVVGRYWAMDRDRRWERTEKAYRLLTEGVGGTYLPLSDLLGVRMQSEFGMGTARDRFVTAPVYLDASYAAGVTDEFVEPGRLKDGPILQDGDAVVFFNFRSDRGRQLVEALSDDPFAGFERRVRPRLHLVTMTRYSHAFTVPVAFDKEDLADTLGDVVSRAGLTQLRAAETEKYPHVTFFFNGGREEPVVGEARILVPSPKVATYDLQPEMSAPELSARVAAAIRADRPDLVVLNIANPDMVGHTGVFAAAVAAVEAADAAARTVVEAALEQGYSVEILADHGNADQMRNPDGSPNTAHSTALVPHLIIAPGVAGPVRHGVLGDVAPTILAIMGLPQPAAMTGTPLVDIVG